MNSDESGETFLSAEELARFEADLEKKAAEQKAQQAAETHRRIVEDERNLEEDPEEYLGRTQSMPPMTRSRMILHSIKKRLSKK